MGSASGGVWKTTNGGMSWTSVFDHEPVASIGAVAVAPSNSEIVWVGTGEDNNQRSVSYGNGVYKSTDGGKTWTNMGLATSQQVGRIRVHPRNPDIVWVAATGPMWAGGGERGVFKTTDGGKTWKQTLSVDEWTGAADLVLDPSDPDVMYASTHQRERRAYNYVGGGPGSGIWKSTDGGETWTRLSEGLPKSDMGRIGLDVSMLRPNIVYAVIEGSEHGVYRSDDAGASWRKMSDIESIPWYFGEIRVDPRDPDTVYHLGVQLQVSHDGGATWERTGRGPHSDQHAMWIDPENPSHIILGNDGGLYVSLDRGETWDFSPNLPVSQFYAVSVDDAEPFFGIAGGLQDNSTWGGPTRTRARRDLQRRLVRDGRRRRLLRRHRSDGPEHRLRRVADGQHPPLRPAHRRPQGRSSPSPPRVSRSTASTGARPSRSRRGTTTPSTSRRTTSSRAPDRGDTWTRLGEDLTRNLNDDSLPMMGKIPTKNEVAYHEGVVDFSTISDVDISTLQRGLLITGSDDGVVAISTDDGATWTKQTRFPGVPDTAYVSKVRLSKHDAAVMYVTFDNHRSNDFHPYVVRSADGGRTWTNITHDLPDFGNVRSFAEHFRNPALLFVGTEMGTYVSTDTGGHWVRLQGGLPTVRTDDLAIQERENTLVIATHGRGFWLLDDLGPLEHLAEAKAAGGPYLVPVKSDLLFSPDPSPTSGTHGARDYAGANPPIGTTVSYYLPAAASDLKLQIVASSGDVVRTLDAATGAGYHHVLWDFRTDAPYSGPEEQGRGNQGGFGGGFFGFGGNQGVPVVPGRVHGAHDRGRRHADAVVHGEEGPGGDAHRRPARRAVPGAHAPGRPEREAHHGHPPVRRAARADRAGTDGAREGRRRPGGAEADGRVARRATSTTSARSSARAAAASAAAAEATGTGRARSGSW